MEVIMQVSFLDKPAFRIVGKQYMTNARYEGIPGFFQDFINSEVPDQLERLSNDPHDKRRFIGYYYGEDNCAPKGTGYSHVAGVETDAVDDIPAGFITLEFPATHYARFDFRPATDGPYNEGEFVGQCWKLAMAWKPAEHGLDWAHRQAPIHECEFAPGTYTLFFPMKPLA